jgi:hypothetical protein
MKRKQVTENNMKHKSLNEEQHNNSEREVRPAWRYLVRESKKKLQLMIPL